MAKEISATTPWEREAPNWIAWARTPGHDVFPYYAPAFFDDIIPVAGGRTLEVGCGEGRMVRELLNHGHAVVALDASRALARAARGADTRASYLAADATNLPFAGATFGTVIAYNSLQTMSEVDDMPRAVSEAARVLQPGGSLCACVAHPMTDIGRLASPAPDGTITIGTTYFEHERVEETVSRNGLQMTFHGWTYTLADYAGAIEAAGLQIDRIREPVPREDAATSGPSLERWRRVPLFLFMRAIKPG